MSSFSQPSTSTPAVTDVGKPETNLDNSTLHQTFNKKLVNKMLHLLPKFLIFLVSVYLKPNETFLLNVDFRIALITLSVKFGNKGQTTHLNG